MRVGIGYDIHRLVAGRPLVLGGVTIPFEKGLLGHSDADVLVHAACDALLGAAGLGDIGRWFPDTDPRYKNVYSITLLRECRRMIGEQGYTLVNMDATVFAEAPRLANHHEGMRRTMAAALETDEGRINIKATTTEGLGQVGAGEGMAAMCVVLLEDARL
ncbi:MAG: 2-C-methyl-D-erythritol 2,4-cyclodiphosphate synthase [Desulfatitalea sp.]|nr:2-C-methyl-D-erythritol 2,4-cyclodiphosphate synthase [Desulfatitalea sp.]